MINVFTISDEMLQRIAESVGFSICDNADLEQALKTLVWDHNHNFRERDAQ